MKRVNILPIIAATLSSLLVLPACSQKEEIVVDEAYTLEIVAVKGSAGQTRALALDEDFLGAPWKAGETVSVFFFDPTAQSAGEVYKKVGTLEAQSDGYTTTLKGKLDGSYDVGDRLMFSYQHDLLFDYRGQTGLLDDIADNHDYAIASGQVSSVSSGTITVSSGSSGSSGLYFSSLQAIFKFNLKDSEGTPLEASKVVIRSYIAATENTSDQDFLIEYFNPTQMGVYQGDSGRPGPVEVNLSTASSVVYVALSGVGTNGPMNGLSGRPIEITATVGDDTYTYTSDSFSFELNKYYVYDVVMKK